MRDERETIVEPEFKVSWHFANGETRTYRFWEQTLGQALASGCRYLEADHENVVSIQIKNLRKSSE